MQRLRIPWMVLVVATLLAAAAWPSVATQAQTGGDAATISALQTEAAQLKTKVALQTEVASLKTRIAQGNAGTPTGIAGGERILYQADWANGLGQWVGSLGWKSAGGLLLNDGSQIGPGNAFIRAPYQPPTPDYAIEASIQLLDPGCGFYYKEFGIVAREATGEYHYLATLGGYDCGGEGPSAAAGVGQDFDFSPAKPFASQPFDPGTDWHLYRLEVEGNNIRLSVDGRTLISILDNTTLSNGPIGLFSIGAQISVRSFKVISL